ncbi:hypothetical protein [Azotosporobacter soli]|uniref:hypothetical protein n=1 Tax=Azotosporobacter soli TaxID=3055040 RepID=UPI0031FEFF35
MQHMMDGFVQKVMHSMAWHTGAKLTNLLFVPIVIALVGYGIYRFVQTKRQQKKLAD